MPGPAIVLVPVAVEKIAIGSAIVGGAIAAWWYQDEIAAGAEQLADNARQNIANMTSSADYKAEEQAQAAPVAQSTTCSGNCGQPPPQCKEHAGKVKEALYRNKRASGGGGSHGYLNRMMEQMCGNSGPGTKSWRNHADQLTGERNKIRDGMNDIKKDKCPVSKLFSRKERKIIGNILNNSAGWGPNGIFYKGPNHPDCLNVDAARNSGRLGDILGVVRPGIF